MKEGPKELKQFLQGTLAELNRLTDQIHRTRDYSEQAEYILSLREFVLEQIEVAPSEDSRHSAHPAR
jgi:hypothetical protein